MKKDDQKCQRAKKQIIALLQGRNPKGAIKRFYEFFSADNPPDCEFTTSIYIELNKQGCFELAYETLKSITSWGSVSPEIDELFKNALSINCDHLVLLGNNLIFERDEKETRLNDMLKRADSLVQARLKEENDKTLNAITKKALDFYLKAHGIAKNNIAAVKGLVNCYSLLNDQENLEKTKELLKKLDEQKQKDRLENGATERPSEKELKQRAINEARLAEQRLCAVQELFDSQKYEEAISEADKINQEHKISVQLLLLKARSLAALRRFKESDSTISLAELQKTEVQRVINTKAELNKLKQKILAKAASAYLRHAIKLGTLLGKKYFIKAKIAAQKSIELEPNDISTLDCLYTAQKYLGAESEAYKTKVEIYLINNTFTPSYDKEAAESMCFIASFAYEGQTKAINEFRGFRRDFLLETPFGRSINRAYVSLSPKLVRFMRPYPFCKTLTKIILEPLRAIIKILNFLFHN